MRVCVMFSSNIGDATITKPLPYKVPQISYFFYSNMLSSSHLPTSTTDHHHAHYPTHYPPPYRYAFIFSSSLFFRRLPSPPLCVLLFLHGGASKTAAPDGPPCAGSHAHGYCIGIGFKVW